jgi:hypothetical protein
MMGFGVVMKIRGTWRARTDAARWTEGPSTTFVGIVFSRAGCDGEIEAVTGETAVGAWRVERFVRQPTSKQVIPQPNGRQRKQTAFNFLLCSASVRRARGGDPTERPTQEPSVRDDKTHVGQIR